ncbi:peptidoglycan DD-metalloendopeptidase family protein [Thiomicrospira sp. WB1]|uniref:peptidoglycan DD-metalloendopeptidase family protein n=1 Tax=Thiomicrospira sp. WB1 TaxID=1685380 RepID=UPI001F2B8A62|nr:peptidoglycan DD-metalloendopeptidase family protein [Thiomicrospira sp. WB1]
MSNLPLPPPSITQDARTPNDASATDQTWTHHTYTVPANGSLSEALDSLGLSAQVSWEIGQTENSQWLTRLRQGDTLHIWLDEANRLQKIERHASKALTYRLTRANQAFMLAKIERPVEVRLASASGVIQDSFYLSAQAEGLSPKTIMNLADVFAWEIDFIRQLRTGDPFRVIYEKRYIDGEYIGDGDIIAAQINTGSNDVHTAFLLRDESGKENIGYYDREGANLRKAFLRNPVDYVRITSRYKPKRYHPVLKKWRAHRGVDYGGPIGTPIRATGDGQIVKRKWSRSYGRVIYIKHANRFTTVYAHMSRFGKYKQGSWVKQGDVIGYIGQSGLATGPHLHYEFRKNGRHVDPLRVKLPDANPVPEQHRRRFEQKAGLMMAQLERLSPHTQLAQRFD